jgi:arylsulfatase A-like enzyme
MALAGLGGSGGTDGGGRRLGAQDRPDYRDEMLGRLHPLGIFTDLSGLLPAPGRPASAEDQRRLADVLGPVSAEAAEALAPLKGRRPNVLVWALESVGARYMQSFHPLGRARTPILDAAAGRGSIVFTSAYCESPLSAQTIWALTTGMSPPAKPFLFVYGDLPPHGPTLAGEMQRAGYRTAVFSSSYHNMWATRRIFNIEPFELFEDASDFGRSSAYAQNGIGVEDRAMLDGLERWLDAGPKDKPFFSVMWNVETHKPFSWVGMPEEMKHAPDEVRYVATIERADALLGRVLAALEARSLLRDTLVVVMGDHGEGLGRAPRPWDVSHSGQVFEDDVHVPMVLLHPALGSHRVDTLVTHADLMPTLLEVAGRKLPPRLDGRSFFTPIPPAPLRMRSIIWWPMAVRAGHYKLMLTSPGATPQLFDLTADPTEAIDISAREPGLARALHADLLAWHTERFRSDPSFGYRFPPLSRLIASRPRVEGIEWVKIPPSADPSPSPGRPPSPVQ